MATGCFTNANSFISQLDMKRVLVNGGVHSHTGNPQFMGGTNDTDGDLASVSNEDLLAAAGASYTERAAVAASLVVLLVELSSLPREFDLVGFS